MTSLKSLVSIDTGKSGTLTILYAGQKVGLAPERGDFALDYIWGQEARFYLS